MRVQPDNVILLLQSGKWRLLDLGIVARAGALLPACVRAQGLLRPYTLCEGQRGARGACTRALRCWARTCAAGQEQRA